jgi:hypothetical protein
MRALYHRVSIIEDRGGAIREGVLLAAEQRQTPPVGSAGSCDSDAAITAMDADAGQKSDQSDL